MAASNPIIRHMVSFAFNAAMRLPNADIAADA